MLIHEGTKPERVSGSKLARFLDCPSSEFEVPGEQYWYAPTGPAARIGTAAHEAIAIYLRNGIVDIDGLCKQHQCDPDELRPLIKYAVEAWYEIGKWFREPRVECAVKGERTHGYADVMHADGRTLTIADWDFGYLGTDKRMQLLGYADAAEKMFGMPRTGTIDVFHVMCRKGNYSTLSYDLMDIKRFRERLERAFYDCGRKYAPGPDTCKFCPRQLRCMPRRDFLAQCCIVLSDMNYSLQVTDDQLCEAYPKWKALKRLVDTLDDIYTIRLEQGPLDLPDGKQLKFVEQEREQIDPLLGLPIIQDVLDFEQMADAITVSKGKLLDLIARETPKGLKEKARSQLMMELRSAGAVITKTIRSKKAQ